MKHLAILLLLTAFLLSPSSLLGASPLSISTVPDGGYIIQGETLIVQVRIQDSSENRILMVHTECSLWERTSVYDLTETKSLTFRQENREMLPGVCQATAQLMRYDGEETKVSQVQSKVVYVMSVGEP